MREPAGVSIVSDVSETAVTSPVRPLRELVAYDRTGRELERKDVGYIDLSRICKDERGCPPGRWISP